jgi:hypothetical protein
LCSPDSANECGGGGEGLGEAGGFCGPDDSLLFCLGAFDPQGGPGASSGLGRACQCDDRKPGGQELGSGGRGFSPSPDKAKVPIPGIGWSGYEAKNWGGLCQAGGPGDHR